MSEQPPPSRSSRRADPGAAENSAGRRFRTRRRGETQVVGKRSPGARESIEDSDERGYSPDPSADLGDPPDDLEQAVAGPPVSYVSEEPEPPEGDRPDTDPAESEQPEPRRRFLELRLPRLRRPPKESEIEIVPEPRESVGAWTPAEDEISTIRPPVPPPATAGVVPDSIVDSAPSPDDADREIVETESVAEAPEDSEPESPRLRSRRSAEVVEERVGMRSRRRQLQRERRRKAGALSAGAVAIAAGIAALVIAVFVGTVVLPDGGGTGAAPGTRTLLLAQVDAANPDAGAVSLTLFGLSDDGSASLVFLPPGTSSEIPSRGPDRLGDAITLSSPDLMRLTVENLLGIRLDSVLTLNGDGMRRMFDPLAPIPITVPERLSVREQNILVPKFTPGTFEFDAAKLVEYMDFRAEGEGEIQRLSRHQRAWDAGLERTRQISGGDAMAVSLGDGNFIAPAEVKPLGDFLARVASAERGYALLPVDPKQSLEGEERYEPRTEDIQAMVNQRFAGAQPQLDSAGRVRLGILNGNGGVGVTEEVAKILVPEGYRVVFTENADNFEYNETQIVFNRTPFEDTARDVQRRLGTGKLIFNRSPQDIADIIVIVGKDFPPKQ